MRVSGKSENDRVVNETLKVDGEKLTVTCVSMGNPHCVTFVKNVDTYPVEKLGPAIEHHPAFPRRTNAEFVQILDPREVKMRVWERGSGETMACGSGSSALVVAGNLAGLLAHEVTVHVRGGTLQIEWAGNNHVFLSGPAEEAYSGEFDPKELLRTSPALQK